MNRQTQLMLSVAVAMLAFAHLVLCYGLLAITIPQTAAPLLSRLLDVALKIVAGVFA